MIPLACVAAYLPPASSKVFYRGDIITLWDNSSEEYVVVKVDGDSAFVSPFGKKGKADWWKMICLEFKGFMA